MEDADAEALGTPQGDGRRRSLAIREIARRAGRDVRAVHSDVHVLLRAGVLEKTVDGGVIFPYDAIHVDFLLKAA